MESQMLKKSTITPCMVACYQDEERGLLDEINL